MQIISRVTLCLSQNTCIFLLLEKNHSYKIGAFLSYQLYSALCSLFFLHIFVFFCLFFVLLLFFVFVEILTFWLLLFLTVFVIYHSVKYLHGHKEYTMVEDLCVLQLYFNYSVLTIRCELRLPFLQRVYFYWRFSSRPPI